MVKYTEIDKELKERLAAMGINVLDPVVPWEIVHLVKENYPEVGLPALRARVVRVIKKVRGEIAQHGGNRAGIGRSVGRPPKKL